MLNLSDEGTPAPGAMLKSLQGIGPEFAGVLWSEGLFPKLFQPTAGCLLCRIGADALAERVRRSRSGLSKAGNPGCEQP